jgi:hypothetical protein
MHPVIASAMYKEVQVPREDRMSGAADVQGGTSAAGGQDVRSGRPAGMYECRGRTRLYVQASLSTCLRYHLLPAVVAMTD